MKLLKRYTFYPPHNDFYQTVDGDWVHFEDAQAVIEQFRGALKAADRLAHEYSYSAAHEAYWQARGGHEACTVCAAGVSEPDGR